MRILLAVATVAASVLSLLFLLPWLKEGYGIEELPVGAAILVALVTLGAADFAALRSRPALLTLCLVALALPTAAYALVTGDVVLDAWRGGRLARTVRVQSLAETPIEWPGFDGPVGWRLEIQWEHGLTLAGTLFPPKVRMGGGSVPAASQYFGGTAFDASADRFLQVPLFQDVTTPPTPWNRTTPTTSAFDLFPAAVSRYESGRAVCFGAGPRSEGASGGTLSAGWLFVGTGGVFVDLGGPLTAALRARSRLEGRRDEWNEMLVRLEPARLEARGWSPCDRGAGEVCYCAPADGAAR